MGKISKLNEQLEQLIAIRPIPDEWRELLNNQITIDPEAVEEELQIHSNTYMEWALKYAQVKAVVEEFQRRFDKVEAGCRIRARAALGKEAKEKDLSAWMEIQEEHEKAKKRLNDAKYTEHILKEVKDIWTKRSNVLESMTMLIAQSRKHEHERAYQNGN